MTEVFTLSIEKRGRKLHVWRCVAWDGSWYRAETSELGANGLWSAFVRSHHRYTRAMDAVDEWNPWLEGGAPPKGDVQ